MRQQDSPLERLKGCLPVGEFLALFDKLWGAEWDEPYGRLNVFLCGLLFVAFSGDVILGFILTVTGKEAIVPGWATGGIGIGFALLLILCTTFAYTCRRRVDEPPVDLDWDPE